MKVKKPQKEHGRCRVVGCEYQKKAVPHSVSMFSIPKQPPAEFDKWIQLCGNEELLEVPISHLKNNVRLCEKHWLPEQIFFGPKMKKLKGKPLPSQFNENHKPLSDEKIREWRLQKHYGALHEVNSPRKLGMTKPHIVQDECVSASSEAQALKEDHAVDPVSSEGESGDWEPHYMVSQVGSRLYAIPCFSMEVPGMK